MRVNSHQELFKLLSERFGKNAYKIEEVYFDALKSCYLPEHVFFDHARLNVALLHEDRPIWQRYEIIEEAIISYSKSTATAAAPWKDSLEREKILWRSNVPGDLKIKLMSAITKCYRATDREEFEGMFELESKMLDAFIYTHPDRYKDPLIKLLYTKSASLIRKRVNDHDRWHELYQLAREKGKEWDDTREQQAEERLERITLARLRRDVYYEEFQN